MSHETKTIAVLGAGTMGRGIAHVSALAGYATQLFDTSAEALKKAESTVHRNLAKGVEIGKVKADAAETARRNLQTPTDPPPPGPQARPPAERGGGRRRGRHRAPPPPPPPPQPPDPDRPRGRGRRGRPRHRG